MTQVTALDSGSQTRTSRDIMGRLSLMMFLQYFVQGSYLPIASVYVQDALGFTAVQVGYFGAALAVGPILAPFVLGQVVDRLFATERVMAFCHFAAGLLMLWLFVETRVWPVILIGTVYSVLYVPTMMLSNSLAFQHLRDSDLEFPWVRLFGTLGFIVPAYLVEFWWLRGLEGSERDVARAIVFAFAGGVGIVMSLYCLFLPHTPPQTTKEKSYAPGIVLRLLRRQDFLVLVGVSFFIGITHKFFFVWNSPFLRQILDSGGIQGAYEQSISSIGQICELAVMVFLGFMIKKLGFKWTLTIGAFAYALRCVLFGVLFEFDVFQLRLAIAGLGQALHGFCFGCFLAAGYMYVDRVAPADVRGSMQTLYGTCILALSFFVGGIVSGWVGEWFTQGEARNWMGIWFSCAALASLCVVALITCFPNQRVVVRGEAEDAASGAETESSEAGEAVDTSFLTVRDDETER